MNKQIFKEYLFQNNLKKTQTLFNFKHLNGTKLDVAKEKNVIKSNQENVNFNIFANNLYKENVKNLILIADILIYVKNLPKEIVKNLQMNANYNML